MILLVLLLGTAGFFGYRSLDNGTPQRRYRTERIDRGTIVSTVSAMGTVEPVLTVLVGSQVSGTVVRWYTDFNQPVKKGTILAELDQDQFRATIAQQESAVAAAKARVEQASARLDKARLDLSRIERAHSAQSASDNELLEARTEEAATLAELHIEQAEQQVAEARLHAAKIQLDKTIIRSPIDGVVISRNVDAGQTVAASLAAPTLFTIANDLRRMRVNAAVSETDIGRVREGMEAEFRVDAYPDRKFRGVVTQVRFKETVVDNVVTYETLIEVDNEDLLLRPGMTATILFEVARAEDALRVPNAALRFDPQRQKTATATWAVGRAAPPKPRVFKPGPTGFIETDVELGIRAGAYTQVLGENLAEGDVVVVGWELNPGPSGHRATRGF